MFLIIKSIMIILTQKVSVIDIEIKKKKKWIFSRIRSKRFYLSVTSEDTSERWKAQTRFYLS